MRWLFIGITITCRYHMACGEISLPFKDGIISGVRFDGQPIQLFMDTALSGTYVVYKDWYERIYGKGACKYFQGGCYSCPGECNPYVREKAVDTFADGSMLTSVMHEGALTIGKYQLTMQFRLIIGFSPGRGMSSGEPQSYLGLTFRSAINPQTVPRQLYINKIIKKYAVSICSPGDVMSFTGTLIFGEFNGLCAIKSAVTTIPMIQPRVYAHFDSDLSSYGLVSSTGETFTQKVQQGSAVYDTGATSINIPKNMFEILLNKIVSFAGPGVYVKSIKKAWFITDKGYNSFPTLTFSVGSKERPFIAHIPPNKYAINCDGKWCILALIYYDRSDEVLLGRAFFSTYFSSYDFKSRTISIAEYTSR